MTRAIVARILFTLVAIVTAGGAFIADWNASHIYNPHWPPHAKFHNGQTMAMGVLLGLATLLFTWRRAGDERTNVLAASLFGGIYWWTQAAANLFPGVAWTDPELLKPGQTLTQFPPQGFIDIAMTVMILLAVGLLFTAANARRAADRG